MQTLKYTLALFNLCLLLSCSVKPQPISYGKDSCTLCKMVISDKRFGAELVTTKGKALKFDSDECMIRYFQQNGADEKMYAFMLVADHAAPGTLTEAQKAFYVHGENVESPMGGNIASFAREADARQFQQQSGADLVHWESAHTIIK